jgi:hypothetical protein
LLIVVIRQAARIAIQKLSTMTVTKTTTLAALITIVLRRCANCARIYR